MTIFPVKEESARHRQTKRDVEWAGDIIRPTLQELSITDQSSRNSSPAVLL